MNIVVTGGSSGVGLALQQRLLAAGHDVWNLDVQAPLEGTNANRYIATNLADENALEESLAALPAQVDALANVAGIARAADPSTVIAVNFLGLRWLTERLLQRGEGLRIASVASIAGRDWQRYYERIQPLLESPSFAEGLKLCEEHVDVLGKDPYGYSKRLVTAYTLRAAQQALSRNARINCVSPGPIETPLYEQFEDLMTKEHSEWLKAQTGRAADPDEIAAVLQMLLTADVGWLNGVDIPVDGGYSAGIDSGWIDLQSSPMLQRLRAAKSRS